MQFRVDYDSDDSILGVDDVSMLDADNDPDDCDVSMIDTDDDSGDEADNVSDDDSGDDSDDDSVDESGDDSGDDSVIDITETETDAARRARTLREFKELKDELMGTPATWGIDPRTKKPRTRQPNRKKPVVKRAAADYEAHKHEMASEHKEDNTAQFALSRRTRWFQKSFCTDLKIQNHLMVIYSSTWADALKADAAANACADAHASWKTQRAQKAQLHAALADRRAAGVATFGDNCALERRELLRLRDHVQTATRGKVRVLLCPDGCWADALFRTDAMPKGQWLCWQHKSTHKMATDEQTGETFWEFGHVRGYVGALVVCSVEDDSDRLWVMDGAVLHAHKAANMRVTKSSVSGKILPVPADGKTLPTDLGGLVAALLAECAKVVAEATDALPTCTVEAAEARLGKSQAVERAGVLAWIACKHHGVVPWAEMPDAMQADPRNLRLLRDGTVMAYPETQNGKVDLEVLHDWSDRNAGKTTYQFKTPGKCSGRVGVGVNLKTASGRDEAGTRLFSNTYKRGDNDFYVVVIPSVASVLSRKGHVDIWEFPEAALAAVGLLGTADAPCATGCFYAYRNDGKGNPEKYNWTRDYHAAFVETVSGWV